MAAADGRLWPGRQERKRTGVGQRGQAEELTGAGAMSGQAGYGRFVWDVGGVGGEWEVRIQALPIVSKTWGTDSGAETVVRNNSGAER